MRIRIPPAICGAEVGRIIPDLAPGRHDRSRGIRDNPSYPGKCSKAFFNGNGCIAYILPILLLPSLTTDLTEPSGGLTDSIINFYAPPLLLPLELQIRRTHLPERVVSFRDPG